jgi:hypothetical protein
MEAAPAYFSRSNLPQSVEQESGKGKEKSGDSSSLIEIILGGPFRFAFDEHQAFGIVTGSVPMMLYPSQAVINALPGEPYKVLQPISVTFEWIGEEGVLARFDDANIEITGDTPQDAFQSLVTVLLDTFEDFSRESERLGPEPARQLSVLRKYVAPKS